jgi:aryl-alcohol dehydrogenase-like predicted oxidoreductase
MEYRKLGRSGLNVSALSLGTMTFGREADEAASRQIVSAALDAGVNFIDTANTYAQGASETLLGKILKGQRKELVIATKFANPVSKKPNDVGASRVHILNAVEDSLRRLQTEYIDLYYVHHIDAETPVEETLGTLNSLVQQGKVRYIACSNYEAWRLLDSIWTSETRGLEKFIAHQAHYNLLVRDVEDEIVPVAQLKGVGLVPWGPLAGGLLTGKYGSDGKVVAGTRSDNGGQGFTNREPYLAPNRSEIIGKLLEMSDQTGRSPSELALQWLMAKPAVSSVIIGARSAEQAKENLQAAQARLPQDLLQELDTLSQPRARYPKDAELTRGK